VELRSECVDDDGASRGGGGECFVLVDKKSRLWFGGEERGLVSLRRSGFERAAFELPFVEPAVEHCDVLEAE
jgi:hypothetical protein